MPIQNDQQDSCKVVPRLFVVKRDGQRISPEPSKMREIRLTRGKSKELKSLWNSVSCKVDISQRSCVTCLSTRRAIAWTKVYRWCLAIFFSHLPGPRYFSSMLDAETKLREQIWNFKDNLSAEDIILHYNPFIYLLNIPASRNGV